MKKVLLLGLAAGLAAASRAGQPAPLPDALAKAPANAWVKLGEDGHGRRSSAGIVFADAAGEFLCLGGVMRADGAVPYSEQSLNLSRGRWENRFPPGKEGLWGEAAGPSRAPEFPHGSPLFRDGESNTRPNLRAGYANTPFLFDNFACDGDRIVVLIPLPGVTAEYGVKARAWQVMRDAADTPRLYDEAMLGGICYDPVNKEVLGGQGRWAYKDGKWRQLELGTARGNALHARAEALRGEAQALATACRARFYLTESPAESKRRLDELARKPKTDAEAVATELDGQSGWAREGLQRAAGLLGKSLDALAAAIAPPAIYAAEDARDALAEAAAVLGAAPPRRAFSRMVYDPASRKIVLFGGHGLDSFLADTWVYDCAARRWEPRRPKLSPSPRAAHGLVWLPDARKVLLVDGWGCGKAGQLWVYDTARDDWALLKEPSVNRPVITQPPSWGRLPNPAAAGPGDVIVMLDRQDTWAARVDASLVDAEGTAKLGVPPCTTLPAGEPEDAPRWYEQKAGTLDPAAQQALLDKLPANTWQRLGPPPGCPLQNRAWGTVAIDPERQQLLHWGGGHVAYTGNAVAHYSLRTGRYYITYRPEFGIVFAGGEGGMPISQTYQGRAFMTGHAYHGYAYDPTTQRMWACGQSRWGRAGIAQLYFAYDPARGEWDPPVETPFTTDYAVATCVAGPDGPIVWAKQGLFRLRPGSAKWEAMPVTGKLPGLRPDWHGMSLDTKRRRLLLFYAEAEGEVVSYDLATGVAAPLGPAHRGPHVRLSMREQVYLPEFDAVLIGVRVPGAGATMRWAVYDCARNGWFSVGLPGDDPIGQRDDGRAGADNGRPFSAGLGLAHDPQSKLVWAMSSYSVAYVLRPDLRPEQLTPLAAKGE